MLSHLTAYSLSYSFALPSPLPPVLFASATYPALSQYKFRDFVSQQRRVKLYPLWLHIEFCFTDIQEQVPVLVPCHQYVPVSALSARAKERLLRYTLETHQVSLTRQVVTQQPNHHSTSVHTFGPSQTPHERGLG